jgi:hypothetical protein
MQADDSIAESPSAAAKSSPSIPHEAGLKVPA